MAIAWDHLDKEQRQAIEWSGAPLLVLGGPGSGKTEVLAHRIARISASLPPPPAEILGVTFSFRAIEDLRARLRALAPEALSRTLLTTFHGLATDLLRQEGHRVGVQPNFSILTQPEDQKRLLREAIRALVKGGANLSEEDVEELPRIEAVMERLIPQDAIEARSHDKALGQKVALLYGGYLYQLSIHNCLDYPSILVFAHRLLTEFPSFAQKIRERYPHLCVDELQDMSAAQYQILCALVGDSTQSLLVVADDDQTLYQWSGANPARLRTLKDRLSMEVLTLPRSHRCPKEVLHLANLLIQQNPIPEGLPERFATEAAREEEAGRQVVRRTEHKTFQEELAWIVEDLQDRPPEVRGESVILARTRKLLEEAARTLARAGIKAVLLGPKREFESAPFRWLHALFRLARSRTDIEQLGRLCRAFYELEGLHVQVEEEGGDLLAAWFEAALSRKEMEPYTRSFLESAHKALCGKRDARETEPHAQSSLEKAHQKLLEPRAFLQVAQDAFLWFEEVDRRLAGLPQEEFIDFREERKTWEALSAAIVERFGDALDLSTFLQELDLAPKLPPFPEDAVKCLTIHTTKGMEFDHVYLIGLVEGYLPSFRSTRPSAEERALEEERRVCYVALTRAKKTLTLTHASRYFGWFKRPSRFLLEMGL